MSGCAECSVFSESQSISALILRSRPDVVAEWDESEVARRWLMLCPERRDKDGKPEPDGSSVLGRSDFVNIRLTLRHSTVPSPLKSGEKVADRPDEGALEDGRAAYKPACCSMPKMSDSGKDHGHAVFVAGGDDFAVVF